MQAPECPVCLDNMTAPIYQCKSGHSICSECTKKLIPPKCPVCREGMTQMRNFALEDLLSKSKASPSKVSCPHKPCVYTMAPALMEGHTKECIHRTMDCPLHAFSGCKWKGILWQMTEHFKERHPDNLVTAGGDISVKRKTVFLASQGKFLFILTFRMNPKEKTVLWAVQLIGAKKTASHLVYEIKLIDQSEPRRQFTYTDYCFNDNVSVEDVFRDGNCAMMPYGLMKNFTTNGKLVFRFSVKRNPLPENNLAGETKKP